MSSTLFRDYSRRIDALFGRGNISEGSALLEKALQASAKNPAWHAFFQGECRGWQQRDFKAQEGCLRQALLAGPKEVLFLRSMGVCLSLQNRHTEALAWFDKALAVNPRDVHSLRGRGSALSELGREQEALAWFDKALAVDPRDADTLRERGSALSRLGREQEALAWFDKALAVNPQDVHSLRQRGVTLSKLGREQEALTWFDKALAVNPRDVDSLRGRGSALSELGREQEALAWFDKALAVNPQDVHSLRERGVALSKLRREQEALEWFEKALALNERDVDTLRERGVALSKLGREQEALAWFDKALALNERDEHSWQWRGISLLNLKRYDEAIHAFRRAVEIAPGKAAAERNLVLARFLAGHEPQKAAAINTSGSNAHGVRSDVPKQQRQLDFFTALRKVWNKTGSMQAFLAQSKAAQERLDVFIREPGGFDPTRCFLLGLRKWNSYTPSLPGPKTEAGNAGKRGFKPEERSIGGGYFLYCNGEGVVIDPGFNFIENFHAMGGMLADIRHMVITHAHNDHTSDLESLLSLFYRRAKTVPDSPGGPNLYLNIGTFQKFAPILNLRSSSHLGRVRVMAADEEYALGTSGLRLRVLPAYHDEVLTKDYAVGLLFSFPAGQGDGEKARKTLLFTGDTGFVPQAGPNGVAAGALREISSRYPLVAPDFLVPHLGSLHPDEFKIIDDQEECLRKIREQELFYPNHLGFMGTVLLIGNLRPRHVFLSEFGEELHGFLPDLMTLMRDCIEELLGEDRPTAFLPMDLLFACDLQAETVYSLSQDAHVPLVQAGFVHSRELDLFHYANRQEKTLRPPQENLPRFLGDMARKTGLFFRTPR